MKATGSQYLSFWIGSRSFFSAKMTIVIRKHQMVLSITRQDIYIYELPNHKWKEGIIHLLSGDKESKGGGEYDEHISGRTKAQTFWRGGKGGCEYDERR